MNKANEDIHQAIKTAGVRYWQVAQELGLNDGNFSRRLRRELAPAEKERIFAIIQTLKTNQ